MLNYYWPFLKLLVNLNLNAARLPTPDSDRASTLVSTLEDQTGTQFILDASIVSSTDRDSALITARKRSLGQGNIFTPVCHSVHRGEYLGRCIPGPGTPPRQVYPSGPGTPPRTRYTPRQVHPPEQCMLGDTNKKRAVHILLVLVTYLLTFTTIMVLCELCLRVHSHL